MRPRNAPIAAVATVTGNPKRNAERVPIQCVVNDAIGRIHGPAQCRRGGRIRICGVVCPKGMPGGATTALRENDWDVFERRGVIRDQRAGRAWRE